MRRIASRVAKERGAKLIPPPPPRRVPELTHEIVSFANQMRETKEEVELREQTVERCKQIMHRIEPDAEMHVFGSCATGLRLPQGDVDLMIESPKSTNALRGKKLLSRLGDALRDEKITRRVLELPHAKVPILKWTDTTSRVQVDACVNNVGALRTTALLARSAGTLPALRPLALVLKSQMRLHRLHETRTGGVGSYLLTHMVRHVLLHPPPPPPDPEPYVRDVRGHRTEAIDGRRGRQHRRDDIVSEAMMVDDELADADTEEDLGGRLLRFYWYYGYALDLSSSVVMLDGEATRLADGPDGAGRFEDGYLPHPRTQLSLNDPAKPTSDIGAKAYNFMSVRRLLRMSYQQLLKRIAIVQTAPSRRHVPNWMSDKRRREQISMREGRMAPRGGDGAVDRDERRGDEDNQPVLSIVLPRWRKQMSQREARHAHSRREQLGQMRLEEQEKMEVVAAGLAAELEELRAGTAKTSDPLWS